MSTSPDIPRSSREIAILVAAQHLDLVLDGWTCPSLSPKAAAGRAPYAAIRLRLDDAFANFAYSQIMSASDSLRRRPSPHYARQVGECGLDG
jgi:hypothetical protein